MEITRRATSPYVLFCPLQIAPLSERHTARALTQRIHPLAFGSCTTRWHCLPAPQYQEPSPPPSPDIALDHCLPQQQYTLQQKLACPAPRWNPGKRTTEPSLSKCNPSQRPSAAQLNARAYVFHSHCLPGPGSKLRQHACVRERVVRCAGTRPLRVDPPALVTTYPST